MIDLVPLVNKTVPFKFHGAELRLDLSHALFSSFDIDAGTRLLLKAVGRDEVLARAARVLDAGSGTGVIGIAVAAAFPECQVEARDRDLLACAFTERNRARNKVKNLHVSPGLLSVETPGLAADPAPYDFILTNIPAKAGGPVLEAFFRSAKDKLAPGGRLGVVIVNPLVEQAKAWLASSGWSILVDERGANHHAFVAEPTVAANAPALGRAPSEAAAPAAVSGAVSGAVSAVAPAAMPAAAPGAPAAASSAAPAHVAAPPPAASGSDADAGAAPAPGPAPAPVAAPAPVSEPSGGSPGALDFTGLDLGLYLRRRDRFKLADASYELAGIWGLPEFDTVGYASEAAAELGKRVLAGSLNREVLVVNPGIGHLAAWMARRISPERVTAASRDVLSLAATGANLASMPKPRPAYRAIDALRIDELPPASFDLIAWAPDAVPEYDWIGPLWTEASRLLKRGGTLIVTCPPTELLRLEKKRAPGFRKAGEKRRKTFEAAAYVRT